MGAQKNNTPHRPARGDGGLGTGSRQATNPNGAGEGSRTPDIELGKDRTPRLTSNGEGFFCAHCREQWRSGNHARGCIHRGTVFFSQCLPERSLPSEETFAKMLAERLAAENPPEPCCEVSGSPPVAVHRPGCIHFEGSPPGAPTSHELMSELLRARHRADADLQSTALAAAKAASVYIGAHEALASSTAPGWDARVAGLATATAELHRTVEAFRRAEVAHSAALRALEDAR